LSNDLKTFLEFRNLNQISTRVFYLYLRTVEAAEEDRTTLFNYFLSVLGSIAGAAGLILISLNFGKLAIYYTILGMAIIIGALVIVRKLIDPNSKAKQHVNKIWLSLYLDQIEKQSMEIIALQNISKDDANSTYATDLSQDCCTILKDNLARVNKIREALGEKNWKPALESIHITQTFFDRRMNLGKAILQKYCGDNFDPDQSSPDTGVKSDLRASGT